MLITLIIFIIGILFLAGVVIAGYTIFTYNSFITLRERVYNGKAQISAQIESRWDAVSNLISATKQYEEHETEVLENITDKRTNLGSNSTISDIEKNDAELNNVLGRLIAISENYPELKASEVYQTTMESINKYEDNVRHSRMIYNDVVTKFNRKLKQFPTNLIGNILNFELQAYFEQSEEKASMPTWD